MAELTLGLVTLCIGLHCGAEAGFGYDMEFERAFTVGQRNLQNRLIRPVPAQQFGIVRYRFDVYAAPAAFIKGFADRVDHGMLCAHVNVTAMFDVLEGAP